MERIIIGTIGTGNIVKQIINAVIPIPQMWIGAAYSRDSEKARNLLHEYSMAETRYLKSLDDAGREEYLRVQADAKIPYSFDSLENMLKYDGINTVYIASPNSLHYEQIKKALMAGKHVICEKPMCPLESQVKEVAELAEKMNLMLVDATPTQYLPNFSIIKENLEKIGRIRLVSCNYSQYSSRYDKLVQALSYNQSKTKTKEGAAKLQETPEVPNVFNPLFGSGSLMDIGYYNIYLAIALFGSPESCDYYPNLCRIPVGNDAQDFSMIDTSGTVVMKYPDFIFTGTHAKDTWGINYFQIEGDQGYIYIENGSNGLGNVRVETKEFAEEYDMQDWEYISKDWGIKIDQPFNRWHYEMDGISKFMLNESHNEFRKKLEITKSAINTLENLRKKVNLYFPNIDMSL